VASTLELGTVIMSIAGLSFIGFGVPPGSAEWGRMIADGRTYMFNQPWIATFPGIAIFIASIGFSLLGDGLRDILDPRLRR
jgi:peptide/nickel transport system permease protein